MKKLNKPDGDIAEIMEAYQLPSPSGAVKTRVLYTARDAWSTADAPATEIPGLYPVLRFALSLAFTIALTWGTTHANKRAMARWQPAPPTATRPASRSIYTAGWPRAGLYRLAAAHVQKQNPSQQLFRYRQQMREALEQDERVRSTPRENASDRRISQARLS